MRGSARRLVPLIFLFFAVMVKAEDLKLSWSASESDKVLWQGGISGTGPEGPVLSFKIILPESIPTPDIKIVSSEYMYLKEIPPGAIPCGRLVSWGQSSSFRGYPYKELLVFPLQWTENYGAAKLLTRLEVEFPGIPGPDGQRAMGHGCDPLSLKSLFFNYWDGCKYDKSQDKNDSRTRSLLPESLTPIYSIKANEDGIIRLTRSYLDSQGVDLSTSLPVNYHIVSRGVEIPFLFEDADGDFSDPEDAIVFFGQKLAVKNRSIWNGGDFTDENVYMLFGNSSAGLRMDTVDVSDKSYPSYTTFVSNAFFESNDFMDYASHMRPNGELWFWGSYITHFAGTGDTSKTFSLDLPHPSAGGTSFILTFQQGGTNNILHKVKAKLNSGSYTSFEFSGVQVATLSATFTQAIPSAANTLTLTIPSSQPFDNQALDTVTVSYLRTTDADNSTLMIEDLGGNKKYTAGSPTYPFSSRPLILDVSETDSATGLFLPKNCVNASFSGGVATLDISGAEGTPRKIFLSSLVTVTPSVEEMTRRDLSEGCDLLIITHPDFHPGGIDALWQEYLAAKEEKYSVLVVDAQEIYDNYSHGIFDPTAMKDFLADAHYTWDIPPSYVLLIGDASFDYKNYMNDAGFKNWVPTMCVENVGDTVYQGWFASDSYFGDADGDGYPETAIGRIPVRSYSQLEGVLGKLLEYEYQVPPEPWRSTQLFVADTYREPWEQEFETYSDFLLSNYSQYPYASSTVYYHDAEHGGGTDDDACAEDVRGAWNGSILLHFAGHSGRWYWGYENGMFSLSKLRNGSTQSDLDLLPEVTSPVTLPFLVNSTCYTAGFAHQSSLGPTLLEDLFTAPDKGSIGSTGFSSLSYLYEQEQFATPFYENIFGMAKERTVGDAVETARFNLPSSNSRPILSLVLLGDPTLELRLPVVPPPLSLSGMPGNQIASLEWGHPSPAPSKYDIYRSTDGGATFQKRNSSEISYPVSTYIDSGLTNNQAYVYYTVSLDASGFASAPSNLVTVVPLNPSAPAAPTGVIATDQGTGASLRIQWNANSESDLSYYKLYRGTSPGSYSYNQQYPKTTTSVLMSGLDEGVRYYFAVTATNTSGKESQLSAETSAVPTSSPIAVKVPALITDLIVTRSGAADLLLSWSKPLVDIKGNPVTVASFDIYRVTHDPVTNPYTPYNYDLDLISKANPNAKINVPAISGQTVHSYTDPGAVNLSPTVTYLVVAIDPSGNRGPASHDPPAAVMSLMVTKNSPVSPTLINFNPVTTTLNGAPTGLITGYRLFGLDPPMVTKDHVSPASPVLTVNLGPSLDKSSCDGGMAVYCDSSTDPPMLYTVVAVDNRGNTSLY